MNLSDICKSINEIIKQAPPGPPPRPGLVWNSQSHRWRRKQKESSGKKTDFSSMSDQEVKNFASLLERYKDDPEAHKRVVEGNLITAYKHVMEEAESRGISLK